MKFFKKNKFIVLVGSVIILSLVYFAAQKAIDNYSFKKNKDIISEEGEAVASKEDGKDSNDVSNNDGEIPSEEVDLELEEVEIGAEFPEVQENGEEIPDKIFVYITGEVNYPGVQILNEGSRIVDAINAAGGTTAKADISKVNLVYIIEDGMKINIPNKSDLKNNSDFEYITMNSGDGGNSHETSKGDSSDTGSSSTSSGSNKKYIVNINTATQTELETLPGIRSFNSFKYY